MAYLIKLFINVGDFLVRKGNDVGRLWRTKGTIIHFGFARWSERSNYLQKELNWVSDPRFCLGIMRFIEHNSARYQRSLVESHTRPMLINLGFIPIGIWLSLIAFNHADFISRNLFNASSVGFLSAPSSQPSAPQSKTLGQPYPSRNSNILIPRMRAVLFSWALKCWHIGVAEEPESKERKSHYI